MSKIAIVAYDLDDVDHDDNRQVKADLQAHTDVFTTLSGINELEAIPQWITVSLPDTTILVEVADDVTTRQITVEVDRVILNAGARTGKIFVAFIDITNSYIYNNETRR